MKPGLSCRVKVFIVIVVILSVGLTSVARAENHRWIVIFLEGTNLELQKVLFEAAGIDVVHTLSFINALAIELPFGDTLDDLLAFLLGKPWVHVEPDTVIALGPIATILEKEPPQYESYDWGQVKIGTPVVHEDVQQPGAGVTIAIVDTGVDVDHPDLKDNIIHAYNARPGVGSPDDDNGHGTHIAGIIAARANGQGVVGVAPQARLVSVKVLDSNGKCHLSDFINGLQYVYTNKNSLQIKIVNVSLGFCSKYDRAPLELAIERIYESGLIMVAAAGNRLSAGGGAEEGGGSEGEGAAVCDDTVRYPAAYDNWVIAVAASDYDEEEDEDIEDYITGYSLPGPQVDMTAPGGSRDSQSSEPKKHHLILSTRRGGGYGLGSGTSQATAHVTGSIALALQHEPEQSFERVRDLLKSTAFKLPCCEDVQQGAGLLDVEEMMSTPE